MKSAGLGLLTLALASLAAGDYAAPFNDAMTRYRAGRYAEAGQTWRRVAKLETPREVRAMALFNAGDAAFRAGQYAEAAALFRETLAVLEAIHAPAWPRDWTPAKRQRLLARLRDDALFNLELALRMLKQGEAPSPDQQASEKPGEQKTDSQKPGEGQSEPGESPSSARGKVEPLSPQRAEEAMQRAAARDVPPPPSPRNQPAQEGRPDW